MNFNISFIFVHERKQSDWRLNLISWAYFQRIPLFSFYLQILCTQSPETLTWTNLTKENYQKLKAKGFEVAKASYHSEFYKNRQTSFNHWIVKTKKCHTTYIGSKTNSSPKLEYALIDGTYAISDEFLFLMYKKQNINGTSQDAPLKSKKSKSFISHRYEYHVRPGRYKSRKVLY